MMYENKRLFILNILAILGLFAFLIYTEPQNYKPRFFIFIGLFLTTSISIFVFGRRIAQKFFPYLTLAVNKGISKTIWNIWFLYIGWQSHEFWIVTEKNHITFYIIFSFIFLHVLFAVIKEYKNTIKTKAV